MFHAMSNSGLSLADIKDSVSRALDETGARVIFTDLPAGSCTMAVRKIMRARIDVTVVTGVNLSVLLDFAMHETIDPVTAARSALERGRASIVAHGA